MTTTYTREQVDAAIAAVRERTGVDAPADHVEGPIVKAYDHGVRQALAALADELEKS